MLSSYHHDKIPLRISNHQLLYGSKFVKSCMQSHSAPCLCFCINNRYYLDIICQDVQLPSRDNHRCYPILLSPKTSLDLECFPIKIALIPDAILSLYPTLIHVKSPKKILQPENMDSWLNDGTHCWSALKQHAGSRPASWLLLLNLSSDLHVESISLWASMKPHSIIYFSHKEHKTWLYKLLFI